MKIKRFTGPDMRHAIKRVREALGPDAVILSNQTNSNGVEVVAAVEYDESLLGTSGMTSSTRIESSDQDVDREDIWNDVRYGRNIPESKPAVAKRRTTDAMTTTNDSSFREMQSEIKSLRGLLLNQMSGLAWGNETRNHPLRARLLQRLMALGLSPHLAREISEQVRESDDMDQNWRMALGLLAHRLPVGNDAILNKQQNIVAVVGATGVGKTTTIAKLAARYILRHGKGRVALVTTDNYRVAAHEQLRSYARIMGAPLRVASDLESLQDVLLAFRDKELVLIDTAGMSQRDMRLNEQFNLLTKSGYDINTYLAMATNSQRGVLSDVVRGFKSVPLAGCILTKVDETISLGGSLAVAIEQDLPVSYVSDGQQVPEDLHPARSHTLVSRAVAIMQEVGVGSREDPVSQMIGGMAAHANG